MRTDSLGPLKLVRVKWRCVGLWTGVQASMAKQLRLQAQRALSIKDAEGRPLSQTDRQTHQPDLRQSSAHAQCAPPSASGEGVMAAWWSRSTRLKVPFGSPSQSPISLLSTPTSARLQLHRSSALQYMQGLARPLGRMGGPEKPCKPGVREGPRGNWRIEVMSSNYRRKRVAKVKCG